MEQLKALCMVDPIDEYGVVLEGLFCPEVGGNASLAGRKGSIHRITGNAKNKFYHEVDWHDFNSDGMKDILSDAEVGTLPSWTVAAWQVFLQPKPGWKTEAGMCCGKIFRFMEEIPSRRPVASMVQRRIVGSFQDLECKSMKSRLVELEHHVSHSLSCELPLETSLHVGGTGHLGGSGALHVHAQVSGASDKSPIVHRYVDWRIKVPRR